ncbi:MAG: SDR family oxidoreductase [candidate division Zixibacteria bacterium]|nr:SDR family oxidoreductase [candidate division Zixibacteria bacterium]
MDLGLKDKTALVTGASSGLGFASAMALVREGVSLAINSRSKENLSKAADKIEDETGRRPITVVGDLSGTGTAEVIARAAADRLGAVDILVSNAGGPPAGPFLKHDPDTWRQAAELTLHSAIDLTRAVLPLMQAKRWGRIIYITSMAVRQPADNLIISNTLRAGLTGFAKTISNEFASEGITVNTVCPGYTNTERLGYLAKNISEQTGQSIADVFRGWKESIPCKRLGEPEEPADLICFLASRRAAYITGTAIPVDGGYIKGLL